MFAFVCPFICLFPTLLPSILLSIDTSLLSGKPLSNLSVTECKPCNMVRAAWEMSMKENTSYKKGSKRLHKRKILLIANLLIFSRPLIGPEST